MTTSLSAIQARPAVETITPATPSVAQIRSGSALDVVLLDDTPPTMPARDTDGLANVVPLFGETARVAAALRERLEQDTLVSSLSPAERKALLDGRTIFRRSGDQKTVIRLEQGRIVVQIVAAGESHKKAGEILMGSAKAKILAGGYRHLLPVRHSSSGKIHPADVVLSAYPHVLRFYDARFRTAFYIDASAVAMENPKGIILLHPGGGAQYSNGGIFAPYLSLLAKAGYVAIAFDPPFHHYGVQAVFGNAYFSYLHRMIDFWRERYDGAPVVFFGRSTGAPVAMRYRQLYPDSIAGVYAMSGYLRPWIRYNERWFERQQAVGRLRINGPGTRWVEGIEAVNGWLDNPMDERPGLPPVLFAAGALDFGGEGEYPPGMAGEWSRIAAATGQQAYIASDTGHNVLDTGAPGFREHWMAFVDFLNRAATRSATARQP